MKNYSHEIEDLWLCKAFDKIPEPLKDIRRELRDRGYYMSSRSDRENWLYKITEIGLRVRRYP